MAMTRVIHHSKMKPEENEKTCSVCGITHDTHIETALCCMGIKGVQRLLGLRRIGDNY